MFDIERLRDYSRDCPLIDLFLPDGLDRDSVESLAAICKGRASLETGAHLFLQEDHFNSLYTVRQGALKSYFLDKDGRERVTGFSLPGDLLGLDAVYSGVHRCSAQALAASSLCQVPFTKLEKVADQVPELHRQLVRLMSREIADQQIRAADHTALERVAGFLLDLTRRSQQRGFPVEALKLDMSRSDIANYLRLATETVSRSLSDLQRAGLIKIHLRDIKIVDPERLRISAGSMTTAPEWSADHARYRD